MRKNLSALESRKHFPLSTQSLQFQQKMHISKIVFQNKVA